VPTSLSRNTNANFVGQVLHDKHQIYQLMYQNILRPFVAGLLTLSGRQLQVALRVRETGLRLN
jgi:hypothetical protein